MQTPVNFGSWPWHPSLAAEFVRTGARYVSTGTDLAFLLAPLAGLAEMAVDRDVRRDRPTPQVVRELRHVIGLVRAERDPAPCATPAVNQLQRGLPLGCAGD